MSDHVRSRARETSEIFGRVVAALTDTVPGSEADALLQLVADISETGIPLVVTDVTGRVVAARNIDEGVDPGSARMREVVAGLREYSAPIDVSGVGQIYFGPLPATRSLRWLPILQIALLAVAALAGTWAYRIAMGRDRDRLLVGMARESAHQLGTPLMSARAWVDRLLDGDTDVTNVANHLLADIDRLEKVAQRFERIGRPGRRDRVGLGTLAEKTAQYFEPRLPKKANRIEIRVNAPSAGPIVRGDAVLLGWAMENLIRNAIDSLSGRGGRIAISVVGRGAAARLTVEDDGPGIKPDVRSGIFQPGVTTKTGGWGLGLPLARRIIEEVHGGRLELEAVSGGTRFTAEIPVSEMDESEE